MVLVASACASAGQTVDEDAPPEDVAPPIARALERRPLPEPTARRVGPPVALTASDGTGLRLESLRARAAVSEPLALTELHFTFANPEDRTIEGQFTIDLPPGSAISRLAMKIGDDWQEAEVVERQAARVAYEDFLHRKQDPALLENQAGNRFSARVFPIPARGRKEIVLAYSQTLDDSHEPYELLLAGLPQLDELDVQVRVDRPGNQEVVHRHQRNVVPETIEVQGTVSTRPLGLRHGRHAVARVAIPGTGTTTSPIEGLTILFDTSASRALDFAGQVRRLGALVDALVVGGDFRLRVVAFDQEIATVFDGDASMFGATELEALYGRGAFGASDLEGALRRVASLVPGERVVLMGDGIPTAGALEAAVVGTAARELAVAGVHRVDAIIDGGLQDRDMLAATTTALAQSGVVVDARLAPAEIADALRRVTLSEIDVAVPGASFVWPRTIRGAQPGDEVVVYAELPKGDAMRVVLDGDEHTEVSAALAPAAKPLLERALASARIDALTFERSELAEDATQARARMQADIVALSRSQRVLSDFTALLVLETEQDYARFGIDRRALDDILTVGDAGIEVIARRGTIPPLRGGGAPTAPQATTDPLAAAPTAAPTEDWGALEGAEVGESFGVGGLGLSGTGRGGGGTGEGTIGLGNVGVVGRGGGGGVGRGSGFGGRSSRTPAVRQGQVTVSGSIDVHVIRRVVRRHNAALKACYDAVVIDEPEPAGRLAIRFSILADGRVSGTSVEAGGLDNAALGTCVLGVFARMRFPTIPSGGSVTITYPFVFSPSGGIAEAPRSSSASPSAPIEPPPAEPEPKAVAPYSGRMLEIMTKIASGDARAALVDARRWHDDAPGDVLALLAMGEANEALGRTRTAARVYGSLVDLFPARADMRRYAGNRLERLPEHGRALAIDTYRNAVAQRPDHPASHRLYAWSLVRAGRLDDALDALVVGAQRRYPADRFRGVDRILREDAGLVGAAIIAADASTRDRIVARLAEIDATPADGPSTRFVMSWETDANDVDFHVHDGKGGHAFFGEKTLPSGGSLFADVTTGYGPECFAIDGEPTAYPYTLVANYYARGPMGYGMGTLQIVGYDGAKGFRFDDRPFVIMNDGAMVPLGQLTGPLSAG